MEAYQPWVLQPLTSGIIGVSTRGDDKASVVFYCTADKTPRLRFMENDENPMRGFSLLKDAIISLNSIEVFGHSYPNKNVLPISSNSQSGFEVILSRFDLRKLREPQKVNIIDPDIAMAVRWHFSKILNLENAPSVFSAAMKNCLK